MPGLALCLQHNFLWTVASLALWPVAGPALTGTAQVAGHRPPTCEGVGGWSGQPFRMFIPTLTSCLKEVQLTEI